MKAARSALGITELFKIGTRCSSEAHVISVTLQRRPGVETPPRSTLNQHSLVS
jgi:hypothetical protein